jgi:hypothetical protein
MLVKQHNKYNQIQVQPMSFKKYIPVLKKE